MSDLLTILIPTVFVAVALACIFPRDRNEGTVSLSSWTPQEPYLSPEVSREAYAVFRDRVDGKERPSDEELLKTISETIRESRWETHYSFTFADAHAMYADQPKITAAVCLSCRKPFKVEVIDLTVHVWFDDNDDAISFHHHCDAEQDFVMHEGEWPFTSDAAAVLDALKNRGAL